MFKKIFKIFTVSTLLVGFSVSALPKQQCLMKVSTFFNSLAFYIGGVLVAFMAAGFCMLESGLVTTKSVSTIAAKYRKICNLFNGILFCWI